MRAASFWIDAGERAIKTFAQALLAMLVVGAPIWESPWTEAVGVALAATVASLLTSIASVGTGGSASAVEGHIGRHRAGG